MKKIIILLSLLVLMTTMAFAQIEPGITTLTEIPATSFGQECAIGNDDIYCIDMEYDRDGVYMYDTTEETFTLLRNLPFSFPVYVVDKYSCNAYNDEIFCIGNIGTPSTYDSFKLDLSGTYTDITDFSNVPSWTECALRPESDEMWCVLLDGSDNPLLKYDVSEDSWTEISELDGPNSPSEYMYGLSCEFRNDDELYCTGAYSTVTESESYVTKYVISTNTTTHPATMPHWGYFRECVWFEDIFYCMMGEYTIPGYLQYDDINYYDPSDDSVGTLETTFPLGLTEGGSTSEDGVVYFIGGADYDWNIVDVVYKAEWSVPVVESTGGAIHQCNINPNCNPATMQPYTEEEKAEQEGTTFAIAGESKGFNLWTFLDNMITSIRRLFGLK